MRTALKLLWGGLIVSLAAYGQAGFGSISGRAFDPSGSVIPGVKVVATNVATGEVTQTVAGSAGEYQLFKLKPGSYTLMAEAAGFKKLDRTGVTVRVDDALTIDLNLALGTTSDTVTVTSEAPLLRTEDVQVGDVIDQNAIMNLPVVDHEPLELLRLSSNFVGSGNKGDAENRINGGRPLGLEYFVDGIAVETGMAHNVVSSTPTMQGVEEFKVLTNGISAEYGRMSGGAVELVTKSGSNEFHGQLFEYDQNREFNANSWGQNFLGNDKPLFQYNLFGGAIGGPVLLPKIYDGRNRTFFYFDYQRTKFNTAGVANTGSMPTQDMRNGNMSGVQVNGVPAMIYDQYGPSVCSSTGKPFDSSCVYDTSDTNQGPWRTQLVGTETVIPASQFDPVSAAIQKLLPMPNRTADANCTYCNNYIGYSNSSYTDSRYSGRIDQVLSTNQRLFGRFTYQDYTNHGASRWWGPLQAPNTRLTPGASGLTLDYSNTINPTTILEVRAGYNFSPNTSGGVWDPSAIKSLQSVLPSVMTNLMGPTAIPWTVVPNMGVGNSLIDNGGNSVTNSSTYQANVGLTKILNRHALKMGYEHRRYYDNFLNSGSAWQIADGDSVRRTAVDNPWGNDSFAADYGAFLLGQADLMQASGYNTRAMNFNYHAAYIQDDFRVNRKLTLNLGLRWEMETPVTERHDKLFFWDKNMSPVFALDPSWSWASAVKAAGVDPSTVQEPSWASAGKLPNGAIVAAGTPEHKSRYGPGYHPGQFAPRLGAAYQLNSKTVLRGSAGMMYLSSSGNAGALSTGGSGFSLSDSIPSMWHYPGGVPLVDTLTFSKPIANPSQLLVYSHNTQQANLQETGGQNVPVVYSLDSHAPREWNWNFSVQRQVTNTLMVEAQYNGNRGVGLLLPDQISEFPLSLFQPQNATLYGNTNIAAPYTQATMANWGGSEQLALLEYPYPQYGPVSILGTNEGRSMYNALVVRAEKRMSHGISFMASYTLSQMKDNTGGPNVGTDITNAGGTGGRNVQSVTKWKDNYTVSPLDQTHRIVANFTAELPIGKGRVLLGHPAGFSGKLLDAVVGGWQFGGIYTWNSGHPLVFDYANGQVGNSFGRIINTWGSYASSNHNIGWSGFSGNSSVFVPVGTDFSTVKVRRVDPSLVKDAGLYVLGNLNPVDPDIRQPGFFNTDLSLMKSFPWSEGKRYFQLRVEASNVWNQRGWPNYQTQIGNANFGLMLGDPNNPWRNPRIMQLSGRIVF